MTDCLLQTLIQLEWRGNIRELRNYIQYMESTGSDVLDIDALPPQAHMPSATAVQQHSPSSTLSPLPTATRQEQELIRAVMKTLLIKPMSRSTLTHALEHQEHPVSEYRVRQVLDRPREHGLLTYGTGRGGIRLTQKGLLTATSL